MTRIRTLGLLVLAALASTALAACGNGGIDPIPEEGDPTWLVGQLVDSPVAGVAYETATHAGLTDGEGHFRYEPGETVRFFLGDTDLGTAPGAATVSPFDLVPGAEPVTRRAAVERTVFDRKGPFHAVLNMSRMLQTLDWDDDTSNAIQIAPEVAALFVGVTLDFHQAWNEFDRDPDFRGVLNAANVGGFLSDHRVACPPWTAIDHVYESIGVDPHLFARTQSVRDDDLDDSPDDVTIQEYDDDGQPTRYERDKGADDSPDSIHTYEYDAKGHQIRMEMDADGDTVVDRIVVQTYDVNGFRTSIETDRDASGAPDEIISYEHDDNGNVTFYAYDGDGNGFPEQTTTNVFDANGNLVSAARDTDASGTVDDTTTWTWDADGNQLTEVEDRGDDGWWEFFNG